MIRRTGLKRSAIKRKPPKKKRQKSELVLFKKKLWPKVAAWVKRVKGNDCISCDRKGLSGYNLHAGHMLAKGTYPAVAWELDNIEPQCAYDNIYLKGHYLEYRARYITKYGQEQFDRLWERRYDAKRPRLEDLKEIERMIDTYDYHENPLTTLAA